MTSLKGKDYIETQDLSDDELALLLDTSADLKAKYHRGEPTLLLPHQTAYLLFFDKSTRTRNAFEAGMTQLGGHAHFLDADVTQISHGETPADTGKILAAMGHGICIRHDLVLNEGNKYMRAMAEAANVPIINMQCDVDHPTQTLADLLTIREHFGTNNLKGLKIAVSWAFAPSYAKPLSRAARPDHADDPLRHARLARPSARLQPDRSHGRIRQGERQEVRRHVRNRRRHGRRLQRRRHRLSEELGRLRPDARPPGRQDQGRDRREPERRASPRTPSSRTGSATIAA